MIKPELAPCVSKPAAKSQELSRLLSAAVVNSRFRALLLTQPQAAITGGYSGESFSLDRQDCERLGAIHASSLADFAAQMAAL
jgi:hypothetical protein